MAVDSWWVTAAAAAIGKIFHYGFNRPVALRYDSEVDGRFYQTPPPPAPIAIILSAIRRSYSVPSLAQIFGLLSSKRFFQLLTVLG
jgi:hypothetical protein